MHVESWQSCINDRFYFVGCLPRLSFVVFFPFFFLLIHLLIQRCTFSSFTNILSLLGGISVSQGRDVVCTRALLCTLGSLSLVTHPRDNSAPSDHWRICRAMCHHFLAEDAVRLCTLASGSFTPLFSVQLTCMVIAHCLRAAPPVCHGVDRYEGFGLCRVTTGQCVDGEAKPESDRQPPTSALISPA